MKPKAPIAADLPRLGWTKTGDKIQPGGRWGERVTYWRKDGHEYPEFFALTLESWKAGFWKGKHVRGQSAVRNSTEATS